MFFSRLPFLTTDELHSTYIAFCKSDKDFKGHSYAPTSRTNNQSSQPQQQSSSPQSTPSTSKRRGLPRKYICDYFNTPERKCFRRKINDGKSCIDQGNVTRHHVCSVELTPDTYCCKPHHVSEHPNWSLKQPLHIKTNLSFSYPTPHNCYFFPLYT